MFSSIVSADWLQDHLNDPQVAIADCRFNLSHPQLGSQQYQEGHIPGAHYLDLNQDLSSFIGIHGGRHPLPDPDVLANKLETMGIHSEPPAGPTLLVAYDDSRMTFAARLWWLLRYLGHDRVAVLDGGFSGWKASGYLVSDDVPPIKTGNFIPAIQSNLLLTIDQVNTRKDLPTVALVDAREGDRYRGERETIDPIAGHIPGAVNYPWQDVTDTEGYLRSPRDQRQRWQSLSNSDEIIVYCGSGVTACVNLLSLNIANLPGKLYAGSWSDWCSYL
ncbi:MAG: sulfurtransferase [Leptolyngbyaceae cyanobacterium CAN_BIN12]|nr:sulfurtransferase [Leptolyngbyaceae cyanobacterium CAN_BIN12]